VQFARANALASYKANTMEDIVAVKISPKPFQQRKKKLIDGKSAKIVAHIHHEMSLHINYCKDFGVTKDEIEASEESQGMFLAPSRHQHN
jgi:hypothetical protein